MGVPVLTTPRLTLRPPRPEDAAVLVRGLDDAGVARMLTRPPLPYLASDARDFIADSLAPGAPERWIVDDGRAVGLVSLDPQLGYWLERGAWGKGYATEAAWAVLRHAFADPARDEVVSGRFEDNPASGAVLRRMGFVETGRRPVFSNARGAEAAHVDMTLSREAWEAAEGWRVETWRLVLAPCRPEDAPALAALGNDLSVARMLMTVPHPFIELDALRRILRSRHAARPGFRAGIWRDGALIGEIAMSPDEAAPGEGPDCEISYWLGAAHHRQGYGREAVGAFVADARRRFGLIRVRAEAWADNAGSIRLLESLGFEKTGEGPDTSPLRPEPAPFASFALTLGDEPAIEAAERAMS
jgi:RimJ/RimL family protein N-acetyltransferase